LTSGSRLRRSACRAIWRLLGRTPRGFGRATAHLYSNLQNRLYGSDTFVPPTPSLDALPEDVGHGSFCRHPMHIVWRIRSALPHPKETHPTPLSSLETLQGRPLHKFKAKKPCPTRHRLKGRFSVPWSSPDAFGLPYPGAFLFGEHGAIGSQ